MQQLSLWKREHPLQIRLAISSHEAKVNQKNDSTFPISLHNPIFSRVGMTGRSHPNANFQQKSPHKIIIMGKI